MEAKTHAAGLRWRAGKPLWRASKRAIRAGYPVKSVNLSMYAANETAMLSRCERLQIEMVAWLSGRTGNSPQFDGTIVSLLSIYQTDTESPYRTLKPSTRHPYDVYMRMLRAEVGARRLDALDGRDLRRWHSAWSKPDRDGGRPRLAAAKMAMTVLKSALSFGKTCRYSGCADLKSIMDELTFASPAPRTAAPTAAQITAARREAHNAGHPAAALAYALQFEGQVRQYDVIGEWLPLDDPRPSALIDSNKKWIGPTWVHVDRNLILRFTPTKTEDTSAAKITLDLHSYPMVMEELASISDDARKGPLIVNPKTGLPYRQWYYRDLWRTIATAAGIERTVWNRDLRAGGITEAREAGAPTDDVAKTAGHNDKRTTARVYDRDRLEAARRVATARTKHRAKNEP
jgi:hypothetical protein